MGVLDEAIKQHLELKRRRGADASEIKAEEHEALGEVRVSRGPGSERAPTEQPPEAEVPQITGSDADEHGPDSIVHQPTEAFDASELAEALGQTPQEAVDEVPQIAESEITEPAATAAAEVVPEADAESSAREQPEPEPEAAPEPAADAEAPASEPVEQDVAEEHDELEATPEFLEDAPEHDKLWFEQKPPKDFDF